MPRRPSREPRTYWQCRGHLDGPCGHLHRDISGAAWCAAQSWLAAASSGGESDRVPWPIRRGEPQPLDEATAVEIDAEMERVLSLVRDIAETI